MENVWNIERTKRLFDLAASQSAEGKSLTAAFEQMAESTGQSVGSVRNYYYAQSKLFRMMPGLATQMGIGEIERKSKPFEVFSEAQSREILINALTGKAGGKSVRTVLWEMAKGDKRVALRFQNKYRSLLVHHKPMVESVMRELGSKAVKYYDPFARRVVNSPPGNHLALVLERLDSLSAPEKEELLKKILL